jgi:ribosomal protein S18 acetylase RimI-like enzyme
MKNFKLVQCTSDYYEFIRQLRIHPENINGFINQTIISEEEQKKYMEQNEKNFFICLSGNIPVGYVGVIDNDIRIATKPDCKQKGVGKFMINEIMNIYPNAKAKIKVDNHASLALFKSCGFKVEFMIMNYDN